MSKFNKVAVVLMVAGLLVLASPTSAVTVEELMAQIALLQSQLGTLQQPSAPSSVSSCSFADASASSLTVGSRGTGVSDLQTFLKNQGSAIYPSGLVTGYFGSLTKAGVAAFQSARGISPAVGYFGPLTRAAVRPLCSVVATPTPTATVVPSGSVSVGALNISLASNSPVSATLPSSAALVPFTKIVFTATGGQVVIDSLTVQRIGLSFDADFSSIVLIDPQGNQVGYSKTLGSTHQAVFSNDLTIPAGTSATYTLAGNLAAAATLTAGDVAALSLVSVVTKDSASISGSLPITGSLMTLNDSTIGTATIVTTSTPAATSQRVGTNGYTLSGIKITAGSTEDMRISKVRWYQNGTAADADVTNLKLMVNGVQVGTTLSSATAKYASFDLSASPVVITRGLSKEFTLVGDLVNGSGRTIIFTIYDNTDVSATGVSGYNTIPTYTGITSQPYFTPSTTTVANGAFNVSKGVLASTYVAAGAVAAPIGAFVFNVQGEDIQVTSAKFTYGSYTG